MNVKVNEQIKGQGAHSANQAGEPGGKPFRVLAMDGGGIYGLFTVLMLKELCRRHKDFLRGDDVSLFAGTSAGALIALALASAENPRDIILNGSLERFFADGRLYGQTRNPFGVMQGMMGLTAWTQRKEADALFQSYYGDAKLQDLKHKVLISTFDLYGNPDEGDRQKWKPRMYYNFPETEENRELAVWRVAYGAAAPVMWRPIINGASDGGIFADSPTVHTIAKYLQYKRTWDAEKNREHKKKIDIDDELRNFRLLSLGVGNKVPHYAKRDFNLGYLSFSLLPTNLKTKDIWPPMVYLALDPQVQTADFEARQLLGEDNYHRLDPEVLGFPIPPILASMYLSKFDMWRNFILKNVRKGMDERDTMVELGQTSKWIEKSWRKRGDPIPQFPRGLSETHVEDID